MIRDKQEKIKRNVIREIKISKRMSSGHSTYPKPALSSTLTPMSRCPVLYLQVILCLWVCKEAALFCWFKADKEKGSREKSLWIFCLKKYYWQTDYVDQNPSDFLLDKWKNQILRIFLPGLARNTEPLNSPRTDCPDNLASKWVKLHLLKLRLSSITYKNWADRKELFHRGVSFANCKSNLG